jgi:hypothetical protein
VRRVLELHDDDLLADIDAELRRSGAGGGTRAAIGTHASRHGGGTGLVDEETPGAGRLASTRAGAALSPEDARAVGFGVESRALATPASTALQDEFAPSAAPSAGAVLLRSPASLRSALPDQRHSAERDVLCAVGASPGGTPSPLRTPEPASAAPLPQPQQLPSLPPTLARSSDEAAAIHHASSPAAASFSSVSFTVSASRATLEGAVRRAAAVRALLDTGAAGSASSPRQAHLGDSAGAASASAGSSASEDVADVALATDTTVWLASSDDEAEHACTGLAAERAQPTAGVEAAGTPSGAKLTTAGAPDNAAAVRLATLLAARRVREQLATLVAARHRRRVLADTLQSMREVWRAVEARVDALRASLQSGVRLRVLVAWRSAARAGAESRRVRREHARIQQMVRHVASRRKSPARRHASATAAASPAPAPAHDDLRVAEPLTAAAAATATATAATTSTSSDEHEHASTAAAVAAGANDTSLDASLPAATIAAPRVTIVVGRTPAAPAAPSPALEDAGARRPPRAPLASHAQTPMEQRAAARRAAREQLAEAYELAQQRKAEERRAAEEAAELARAAERRAAAAEAARQREEQRQALEEAEQRRARRRAAWAAACAHDRERLLRGAAGWAAWRALVRDSREHFQLVVGSLDRQNRRCVFARWLDALWRARGRRAAAQCAAIGAARGVWTFLRMRDALRRLRRAMDERRRSVHAADAFHAMSRARHALSRWRNVVRAQIDAETAALVGAQRALHQRLARTVLRGWRQALRELVRVKERRRRTEALLSRALAYYDAAMRAK